VFARALLFCSLLGVAGFAAPVSILTWNVAGNGATDWSTNSLQVQAIGRILRYVHPDIVTLQEIPHQHVAEMDQFVTAFLPDHQVARFSGTDGILRSVILSRHPIHREQKWLDGVPLNDFGYDGRFTRDLFEAEIIVPGWSLPLHVFTTHLKSGFDAGSVSRRGAESLAISNFIANAFLPAFANRPFVLTGDLNEDPVVHATAGAGVLAALTNDVVGLRLTTPIHPTTGSERTFSIRASLSSRLDYILPNGLLYSNIVAARTIRTGLLDPTPPGLLADDDRTASDHLAVLMIFNDPHAKPPRLTRILHTGSFLSVAWEARPGRRYSIEWSGDFEDWLPAAEGILVGGTEGIWITTPPPSTRFFRLLEEAIE
jgi:endonuclease/exonuclease/phosphatase family metal-dependent hydrolase